MPEKFLAGIDLTKTEIRNAVLHLLATAPASPVEGQQYHDTTVHHPFYHNGTTFKDLTDALTLEGSNLAAVVAAGGASGAATIRNGVATAGDDLAKLYAMIQSLNAIVGGTSADGDALVNTVTELLAVFSTYSESVDIATLVNSKVAANSAITGATKTKITYDSKGLVTGGADATTSDIGEGSNLYYTDERVRDAVAAFFAAGTHSGISFNHNDAGDAISATVSVSGTVGKYSGTIGNGSATSFTITQATHGRAADSSNVVQIMNATTGEVVHTDVTVNPANGTVTIAFAVAPASNAYRVVILG